MQKFFQLIPSETHFDFIGKFKYFMVGSIVLLIAVIVGVSTKGLNYGIDFTGGTVLQVKFAQPKQAEEVRGIMNSLGSEDASVVALGKGDVEYLITSRTETSTKEGPLNKRLIDKVGAGNVQILSADIVGPRVGQELKMAAILSLFYSIILIAIYIWMRFDLKFAPGATVAMLHDLLMAVGFYLVTGREFSITAIAALLTIAGYSVNDTIVIYDRVREMNKLGGKDLPMAETINKALNLTLSRTLLTGLVTLISILPLIIFTKGEIQSFSIAMCFGIFVGCYSTIYIAAPFTIYVQKWMDKKENKTNRPRVVTA